MPSMYALEKKLGDCDMVYSRALRITVEIPQIEPGANGTDPSCNKLGADL